MEKITSINVELDQETLGIVIDVFEHALENDDEIDFSMMDLSPIEELRELTEKLKTYLGDQDPAVISMDFNEWVTYEPYVYHADDLLISDEASAVMSKLVGKYMDWRKGGITPNTPPELS